MFTQSELLAMLMGKPFADNTSMSWCKINQKGSIMFLINYNEQTIMNIDYNSNHFMDIFGFSYSYNEFLYLSDSNKIIDNISTINHKYLGIYYLYYGIIFGIIGSIYSLIIRIELGNSNIRIINYNYYNTVITIHGLLMIFFLIIPVLFSGLGNYISPINIIKMEISLPRVNNLSLILLLFSFIIFIFNNLIDFGVGLGWTLYPPLSTIIYLLSINIIIIGLLVSGISSILSSINFIYTIIIIYTGLNNSDINMYSTYIGSLLFVSFLLLIVLPLLTTLFILLIFDLNFNTIFFDTYSGDVLFFQHLFWFFGHPEVYILILPAFGIIGNTLSVYNTRYIFGNQSMITAMGCISTIGLAVWGHHMYSVGLLTDTRSYFTFITILISIPTGTKLFNWYSTLLHSFIINNYLNIYCLFFLLSFLLGGVTGVILGNSLVDLALHDTYYVVGHFHVVLSVSAIITIYTAILSYLEVLFYNSTSSVVNNSFNIIYHYLIYGLGLCGLFIPMHYSGLFTLPRRIPDLIDGLNCWNSLSSLTSGIVFCSFSVLTPYNPIINIDE
uniref:Cytochrome c oxidase subunit 1 n=1 Tax=Chromera velia TaxID=505693 RepID=X2D9P2_9ALVE|nr:cytochrome c oxidase subunit I [Chromera velia]